VTETVCVNGKSPGNVGHGLPGQIPVYYPTDIILAKDIVDLILLPSSINI